VHFLCFGSGCAFFRDIFSSAKTGKIEVAEAWQPDHGFPVGKSAVGES
jgi:hypothetical protein